MKPAEERGSVTTLFVVLSVFFFAIVSLVAEGGRKLSNLSRAEDIAAEAARSAAATLNLDTAATGIASIDLVNNRARGEADKIVDGVPDAEIQGFTVATDSVVVVVRVRGESYIPGFDLDGVGRHRALALDPFGG